MSEYSLSAGKSSRELTEETISSFRDAEEGQDRYSDDDEQEDNDGEEDENEDGYGGNKNQGSSVDHYNNTVEAQKQSFIDETEGVFKLKFAANDDHLRSRFNEAIDNMVKDSIKYETEREKIANYSYEDYKVKDYHPGSKDVVLDIIHPTLFPYIEGITNINAEGEIFSKELKNKFQAAKNVEANQAEASFCDMWGRLYESSKYQWLPAEFDVAENGTTKITSEVNNLPKNHTENIIPLFEELFHKCLPTLDKCYKFAKDIRYIRDGSQLNEGSSENDSLAECRTKETLYGQQSQVICKVVDYELKPNETHPDGAWHVEGMSHENIIATAVTVVHKDPAINGGELRYKRAFTEAEAVDIYFNVPQSRQPFVDEAVEKGLVELGRAKLNEGDIVVFPNSHVHQLSALENTSSDKPAHRRVVVFWLINPNKIILSTKHVLDCNLTFEEALQHRLKLMEERKRYKQDWNVREIELCEH